MLNFTNILAFCVFAIAVTVSALPASEQYAVATTDSNGRRQDLVASTSTAVEARQGCVGEGCVPFGGVPVTSPHDAYFLWRLYYVDSSLDCEHASYTTGAQINDIDNLLDSVCNFGNFDATTDHWTQEIKGVTDDNWYSLSMDLSFPDSAAGTMVSIDAKQCQMVFHEMFQRCEAMDPSKPFLRGATIKTDVNEVDMATHGAEKHAGIVITWDALILPAQMDQTGVKAI